MSVLFQHQVKWQTLARWGFICLGLASVFGAGLYQRRLVVNTQFQIAGRSLPFTLESALHYRRAKILHDRGVLPEVDLAIQYPQGIRIREIDSIASEPVQVFLARLLPETMNFADKLRWIEAAWFCLSCPLLMLLLRIWTGSWMAGLFSGLLYAVSIAGVLRSTGLELARENFAIPLLLAGYVFAALYVQPSSLRYRGLYGASAALFMGVSLIGWDMIQCVVMMITLGFSLHVLARGASLDRNLVKLLAWLFMGIIGVGILHPYYRYHGLLGSPLILWLAGILAFAWFQGLRRSGVADDARIRWLFPLSAIIGLVLLATLMGLGKNYSSSYGHFAELIWAKLKFLNVKPSDPGLLTFSQRIMWVPSLHSATWELTKWLFPFTFWVVLLVALAVLVRSRRRIDPMAAHWILFFGLSTLAYVFLVRFHVFVALSVSVLAGWLLGSCRTTTPFAVRAMIGLLLSFSVMAEANHTISQKEQMGRPNVYYNELEELAVWLREHVAPEPVLANMGVSAFIAAYGKCPVVLHPKFEDRFIRDRMEQYGHMMFGGSEKELRDWMDELGVKYLVYGKGEFASVSPDMQMRYFVNRMNPPDWVAARKFEREDSSLRYFTRVWGNRKYVAYSMLSRADEDASVALADEALSFLQHGRLDDAESLAVRALALDAGQSNALKVMRHVGSLKMQGVGDAAGQVDQP